MGGSTRPRQVAQPSMRGRVTTPKPQQGVRGNQMIRPPAASLQAPQQKVNPPLAPNGMLNLNPMPQPMPIQQAPVQQAPIQQPPSATPMPQPLTPEIAKQLGVLTGIGDFNEQGNRMTGGVPAVGNDMSMFNPRMMPRIGYEPWLEAGYGNPEEWQQAGSPRRMY